MNPILQNLNTTQIARTVSQLKALGNPQAMLQQMPQYNQVMEYVQACGGNPQDAFYKKAKEMGINPEDILSQLRQ